MTRSRRKSPFFGYMTAETDKPWKQQSARQVRRAVHQLLPETLDSDAMPHRRTIGDAWGLKDGKQRIANPIASDWRK